MKPGSCTVKRIFKNMGVVLVLLASVPALPFATPVEANMPDERI